MLALQGDFEAHRRALESSGAIGVEVRQLADLEQLDGLIIPGGESTTMLRLLNEEQLLEPLRSFGAKKPIFGTCAGAILLATEVLHPAQDSLGLMNITVERNGYGRQIDSRIVEIDLNGQPAEAVFIRAPIIRKLGKDVRVLATFGDTPVLVEQGRHLAATFHPELSAKSHIHRQFVAKVRRESEKPGPSGTLEDK